MRYLSGKNIAELSSYPNGSIPSAPFLRADTCVHLACGKTFIVSLGKQGVECSYDLADMSSIDVVFVFPVARLPALPWQMNSNAAFL